MRKAAYLLTLLLFVFAINTKAAVNTDSLRNARKDSTLRAAMHNDSVKIEKEFATEEKWDRMEAMSTYPLIKEAKMGGIIPVKDPTEIPDPNMDYKLLFELVQANPDSAKGETDGSLSEVARIINLHIAAGIPAKRMMPVLVVHGSELNAITNNAYYNKHFKTDNPNLKLLQELEKAGARIIACGQAMAFGGIKADELLPEVKISLTAQTVLTSYQLKGYVLKKIVME